MAMIMRGCYPPRHPSGLKHLLNLGFIAKIGRIKTDMQVWWSLEAPVIVTHVYLQNRKWHTCLCHRSDPHGPQRVERSNRRSVSAPQYKRAVLWAKWGTEHGFQNLARCQCSQTSSLADTLTQDSLTKAAVKRPRLFRASWRHMCVEHWDKGRNLFGFFRPQQKTYYVGFWCEKNIQFWLDYIYFSFEAKTTSITSKK